MSVHQRLNQLEFFIEYIEHYIDKAIREVHHDPGVQVRYDMEPERPRIDPQKVPAFLDAIAKLQKHAEHSAMALERIYREIDAEYNRSRNDVHSHGYGHKTNVKHASKRATEIAKRCTALAARLANIPKELNKEAKPWEPAEEDLGESLTEPFFKAQTAFETLRQANASTELTLSSASAAGQLSNPPVLLVAVLVLSISLKSLANNLRLWFESRQKAVSNNPPKANASTPTKHLPRASKKS